MPRPVAVGDQLVHVGERTEHRVDVAVVADVVAEVGHGASGNTGDSHKRVDAEPLQVGRGGRGCRRGSPMPSPFESAKLRG